MSALTDRRTAWDAREAIRAEFFQENDLYGPDVAAISAHQREGLLLTVAEGIAAGTGWSGDMSGGAPIDAALIEEAESLAAAE